MFIFAGTSNTQKQRHVVLPVRSKTGLIIFLVCLDKKANKNVKQDCHLFPLCVLPSRVLFWQNDIWVFATTSFPTREICAQHQFCVLIIISVLDPRGRGLDDSDRSWAQRLSSDATTSIVPHDAATTLPDLPSPLLLPPFLSPCTQVWICHLSLYFF